MSDFVTPWTLALQAALSMEFSRQEYWSGLPFPSPGDLPDPGMKPRSSTFQADSLPSKPPGKPQGSLKWYLPFKIKSNTKIILHINMFRFSEKEKEENLVNNDRD